MIQVKFTYTGFEYKMSISPFCYVVETRGISFLPAFCVSSVASAKKNHKLILLLQILLKVNRLNILKATFLPLKLELMLIKFTTIKRKKMKKPSQHQDLYQYY
jgi:hypothetical protein